MKQILQLALLFSLTITTIFAAWRLSNIPRPLWQAGFYYMQARAALIKDLNAKIKMKGKRTPISAKRVTAQYRPQVKSLKTHLSKILTESIYAIFSSMIIILLFFAVKGKIDRRKRHISGQEIRPYKKVKNQLIRQRMASDITLGPLPIVKNSETQHILITGTTGSGKTNCFNHLLPQIRKNGHKAVIIDTTGIFVQNYFQEGLDILLNPFDQRSSPWNPWAECKEIYHYKELAKSLIPQSSHDPFWSTSAQTIFAILLEMLDQEGEKSTKKLLQLILEEPLEELFAKLETSNLQGMRAISLLDPKSEKTATSIRSTAASYVDCLGFLDDTNSPFSIRKWIQDDEQKQWLFLSMIPEQRDALRPLISTWASIAVKSLLGKPVDDQNRTWFIFDELGSLQQISELTTCLAESRKYGGAVTLGIQNLGQLDEIYGPNITKAIVDLCSTKVCFRQTSPELANRMSKAFGEKETMEIQEGISYGANDIRDGVNLSMVSKEKLTIPPTELFSLDNLEAYIKLAGNFPVTKIKFKYRQDRPIASPFVKI